MQANKNNIICFGEVLWDILPSGAAPGGAPMNVAFHLNKLGQHPAIITRIGRDSRGERLQQLLENQHIPTDYLQIDTRNQTGVVYARPGQDKDKDQNMTYEIVQPAAWDFIELDRNQETLVQEADYFVFGSLAVRSPLSRATLFSLLEMAPKKVLDINLRAPHFDKNLILALIAKADILKLNEDELHLVSSWFSKTTTTSTDISIYDSINLLQVGFNISTIIVTCGADGAIVNQNGVYFRHPGYQVEVRDTVGSGDGFLAAFLSKTIEGSPPAEALAYGCAVGATIAASVGAWASYAMEDIEQLIK